MKKDLNIIEEQKVRVVKVKKPRFDMDGLIDVPSIPNKGKWEKLCIGKTTEQ